MEGERLGGRTLPRHRKRTVDYKSPRKTARGADANIAVKLHADYVEDSRTALASRIYAGLIVVWDATAGAAGEWVNADTATIYGTPARVTATAALGAGGLELTITLNGAEVFSETIAANNNADAVLELLAHAVFPLYFTARVSGGFIVIEALPIFGFIFGNHAIQVEGTFAVAVGFTAAAVRGITADYRIVDSGGPTDLIEDGEALTDGASVPVSALGDFWLDHVQGLGAEGRAVLENRGALFYSEDGSHT